MLGVLVVLSRHPLFVLLLLLSHALDVLPIRLITLRQRDSAVWFIEGNGVGYRCLVRDSCIDSWHGWTLRLIRWNVFRHNFSNLLRWCNQ